MAAMQRFKKDRLSILDTDSKTVQELKQKCNAIIQQYNKLENPLTDQGEQLADQITTLISKINGLK
jgi:flagellar hook-associated protein FlgK